MPRLVPTTRIAPRSAPGSAAGAGGEHQARLRAARAASAVGQVQAQAPAHAQARLDKMTVLAVARAAQANAQPQARLDKVAAFGGDAAAAPRRGRPAADVQNPPIARGSMRFSTTSPRMK
jgi:hypothetical protein